MVSENGKREISGMKPEHIGDLSQVVDPRVSPDGSTVAFCVVNVDKDQNKYKSRIWLAAADGSDRARPFTSGATDRNPRWSPDGQWLAFSVGKEDGSGEIAVVPVTRGGERVVVANWPVGISELEWSPDGANLAFVARDPDPDTYGKPGEDRKGKDTPARRITHFFSRLDSEGWVFDRPHRVIVVPADGSTSPRILTPGPYQAEAIAWSPDSSMLAFSSARHDTWDLDFVVDLWTVGIDGDDDPKRITGQDAEYFMPSFSPDGTRIAYLGSPTPSDQPRNWQMGVLDIASGKHIELTGDLDRNCFGYGAAHSPYWYGEYLLCSVETEGNMHVYAVKAEGDGKPELVLGGTRWISGWDIASGTLALTSSDPVTLPELISIDISTGIVGQVHEERRLTNLTGPLAKKIKIAAPEAFLARSADGTEVPCWAIAPTGAEPGKRYPTILNIHGGPFTSYGNKLFDEFQMLAGAGFGVLYCNPRGGSGYSEAWGRAIRWPEWDHDPGSGWGGVDFEDVMACVEDGCKKFDWIDSDSVGIMGGSYGGYMTSWAIGHTKRFKAALSERACNNLLTLEVNSDAATAFRVYVGKSHVEDPGAYLRQSPITYVKEMTTPLLILHSEDDLRCPISQADELFASLRLLGREPEFVRFTGESHELTRSGAPKHRISRAEIVIDWFNRQLGSS